MLDDGINLCRASACSGDLMLLLRCFFNLVPIGCCIVSFLFVESLLQGSGVCDLNRASSERVLFRFLLSEGSMGYMFCSYFLLFFFVVCL